MSNSKSFLTAVLGRDGAKAVIKAFTKTPSLEYFLVPRTVLSWVQLHKNYEGNIPGIDNSYVRLEKTEAGWNGSVTQPTGLLAFKDQDIYSVSANISMALGYTEGAFEGTDKDLWRVGRNIDALVKTTELTKNFAKAWPQSKAHNAQNAGGFAGNTAAHAVARDQMETQTGAPMGVTGQTVIPTASSGKASTLSTLSAPNGKQFRVGLGTLSPLVPGKCQACGSDAAQNSTYGHNQLCLSCDAKAISGAGATVAATADNDFYPASGPWGGDDYSHNATNPSEAIMRRADYQSGHEQPGPADQSDIFDKTELPGKTAAPRKQNAPEEPQQPMKQPKMSGKPKLPKLPTLKMEKSAEALKCSTCDLGMFKNSKFTGCICTRELAKSVKTTAYSDGYVLEFHQSTPIQSVALLRQELKDALR